MKENELVYLLKIFNEEKKYHSKIKFMKDHCLTRSTYAQLRRRFNLYTHNKNIKFEFKNWVNYISLFDKEFTIEELKEFAKLKATITKKEFVNNYGYNDIIWSKRAIEELLRACKYHKIKLPKWKTSDATKEKRRGRFVDFEDGKTALKNLKLTYEDDKILIFGNYCGNDIALLSELIYSLGVSKLILVNDNNDEFILIKK